MDMFVEWLARNYAAALGIWEKGGWAMWALAVVSVFLYTVGLRVWWDLSSKGYGGVPERVWRRWIDHPAERTGHLGELLDYVTGGKSIKDTQLFFDQLRTSETLPVQRDLKVMHICVSAAPLVGLLGTVTGMLTTFAALSSGAGGDKTMASIAGGISEALITTETGLVVALPGLFFHSFLLRRLERYRGFLAHLETVCTQVLHRRAGEGSQSEVQRQARLEIAAALRERLNHQFGELVIEMPETPSEKGSYGTV